MYYQANTPSNEWIEEPDDLWNIHQVDGDQQGVDQGVDDRSLESIAQEYLKPFTKRGSSLTKG